MYLSSKTATGLNVFPNPETGGAIAPTRIVQLIEGNEGYGVAAVLKLIAKEFPDTMFVSLADGGFCRHIPEERLLMVGTSWRGSIMSQKTAGILWSGLRASVSWWKAAREIAAGIGPGGVILHCHSQYTALIAALARLRRKGHKTRIILHYHGKMSNRLWGLVQAAQVGLVGRCVDAIICVSNAVSAYWKGAACEVGVIYNAVEAYAGPDRTGFSKTQSEEKCLLIAASLCEDKGHVVAVDAMAALRDRGCNLRLLIAGGPLDDTRNPFVSVLKHRISMHRLGGQVALLGHVDSVRELARDAWLGLQLRISPEPCPMWALEAMEAGLPLVAARTGGVPELVRDGVEGILIRPNRADELADAVFRLYHDPFLHRRLAANARRRAAAFSVSIFKQRIFEVYSSLARAGRPPAAEAFKHARTTP
jgi:glycosyltransferase involved in cell wall biosynthesis